MQGKRCSESPKIKIAPRNTRGIFLRAFTILILGSKIGIIAELSIK
jgi:hypothetical protein